MMPYPTQLVTSANLCKPMLDRGDHFSDSNKLIVANDAILFIAFALLDDSTA